MYTGICNLNSVIEAADKIVIDNDRSLYDGYRLATEKFVCENRNAAIGGKYGVYLLTGKPLGREFITCDIYTDNAFDFGKRLCNELYKVKSSHVDSTLTYMMTEMRHLEFTIYVDTRPMVKIYRMDKYRGVELMNVINFVKCNGFYYSVDTAAIPVLPEELLLIDIYRSLHLPNRNAQWEDAWYLQDLLFNKYEHKLQQRTRSKSGGDDESEFKITTNEGIHKLNSAILGVLPVGALVVGDYAVRHHLGTRDKTHQRLRLQVVYESAQSLLNLINSKINIKLTLAEFKIPIPGDFQFLKYSFYANDGEANVAVMDVFNATSYEVVPGTLEVSPQDISLRGVNYASILPTLRYRFVDMWVMILIASMNKQLPNLTSLSSNILALHEKMLELVKTNPEQLFPQSNDMYVGIVLNERVVKKRILKESGFRIPPYYPYTYFTNNPEGATPPTEAEKNKSNDVLPTIVESA